MVSTVTALVTLIDDTYDFYGTLMNWELFTEAVRRWDVHGIDHLPDYMKLCFLVLHNTMNQIAFDVFKWADLCKAHLREAKWYYSGYKVSLEEYVENACISIAAPVALAHVHVPATNPIREAAMKSMDKYPEVVQLSAILFRLADGLGI
nr:terpene synthase 10-like [Ziziphus jujuba var. spinosa]